MTWEGGTRQSIVINYYNGLLHFTPRKQLLLLCIMSESKRGDLLPKCFWHIFSLLSFLKCRKKNAPPVCCLPLHLLLFALWPLLLIALALLASFCLSSPLWEAARWARCERGDWLRLGCSTLANAPHGCHMAASCGCWLLCVAVGLHSWWGRLFSV